MIWRKIMSNPNQDKEHKQEKQEKQENPLRDKEVKENPENKSSRLAERKGQRPAFPFRRKPV
jgi:hypothetical protein